MESKTIEAIELESSERRRILYKQPFWFPMNKLNDFILYALDLKSANQARWLHTFCLRASKIQIEFVGLDGKKSKKWMVDLAEARWQSRDSIAENISNKFISVTGNTIRKVEESLLNANILIKKTQRIGRKDIRYIGLSKTSLALAKSTLFDHPRIPEQTKTIQKLQKASLNLIAGCPPGDIHGCPSTGSHGCPPTGSHGCPPGVTEFKKLENKKLSACLFGPTDSGLLEDRGGDESPLKGSDKQASKQAIPSLSSQGSQGRSEGSFVAKPNTDMSRNKTATAAKLRAWRARHEIEPFLFREGDFVPFSELNDFYRKLGELNENQFSKAIETIKQDFEDKTVFEKIIKTRKLNWQGFFEVIFREAE